MFYFLSVAAVCPPLAAIAARPQLAEHLAELHQKPPVNSFWSAVLHHKKQALAPHQEAGQQHPLNSSSRTVEELRAELQEQCGRNTSAQDAQAWAVGFMPQLEWGVADPSVEALPLLREACSCRSRQVRAAAADGPLRAALTKPSEKELAKLENATEREARQRHLAKTAGESLPLLAHLAVDPEKEVRQAVAAAEGPLAAALVTMPRESLPLLAKIANDTEKDVRLAAAAAEGPLAAGLAAMPREAFPLLTKLARDHAYRVRAAASGEPLAVALQGDMVDEAIPVLREQLGDWDSDTRAAAAGAPLYEAVQRMPFEAAQAVVQKVMNDTSKGVRAAAGRAAAWLADELKTIAVSERAKAVKLAKVAIESQADAEKHATLASEAKVQAEKQADIADKAKHEAEHQAGIARKEAEEIRRLQYTIVLVCCLSLSAVAVSWHGQRLLASYRQRQRAERVQRGIDAHLTSRIRTSHKFYFVDADKIRTWSGGPLPHHQELLAWGGWLHLKTWSLGDAINGMYTQHFLVISHRWHTPDHPDPKGDKVADLQDYLAQNPHVKWVWLDFWSLPQSLPGEPRTEEEEILFKVGLANIFMLFIVGKVLVLFDLQYVGRFWTSYELWLSLRTVTADGLVDTPARERRAHLRCMGAANEAQDIHIDSMFETWGEKTPEEAASVLSEDDIVVTNMKDKEQQLGVLWNLASNAGTIYETATAPA